MPSACWRARPPFSSHNKAYGGITHHELRVVAVDAETIGLPFAQAVISVTRAAQSTKEGAQPVLGQRFFVTSLRADDCLPAHFAEQIRSRWGIENRNHWKHDAQWKEDAPRFKNPENGARPRHSAWRAAGALPGAMPCAFRPPSVASPRRRPPPEPTSPAPQVKSPTIEA